MEAMIFDAHGNRLEVDDDIVPDQCTLRVPMPFLDAEVSAALYSVFGDSAGGPSHPPLHDGRGGPAGFRPGFAYGSPVPFAHHQGAAHARAVYLDALTSAWKNPPVSTEGTPPLSSVKTAKHLPLYSASTTTPQRDGGDDHRAWKTYVANLRTAWKNPPSAS